MYRVTGGEHKGKWISLYNDGDFGMFNSKNQALEEFNSRNGTSSIGITSSQRDFMAGMSAGGTVLGFAFEYISDKSGKVDTSSRDYQNGEIVGMAIGMINPGSGGAKVILKGGRYVVQGGKVGFKNLTQAKKLVSMWAKDPVRGAISQNIKAHFLKHGASVGKPGDIVGYLNKAKNFFENRRRWGKMAGEVEGLTPGVTRWHLDRDGVKYFLDLTSDNKIVSFGLR